MKQGHSRCLGMVVRTQDAAADCRGPKDRPLFHAAERVPATGFTLLELLVVVVILGILATIAVRKFQSHIPRAKLTTVKTQIREFEDALEEYRIDNDDYPTTEQGLQALVEKPSTGPAPRNYQDGGYMKRIPKDPWQKDYVYIRHASGKYPYEIISYGRDGREGGEGEDKDLSSHDLFDDK